MNRPHNMQNNREARSRQKLNKGNQGESKEVERQRQKSNQPGWRNDFAKKIKNATNYYKN